MAFCLVGGLLPGELGLELAEDLVRLGEGVAGVGRAGGVDVEQLGGHLEQLLLDPRLAQREGAAAQPVEPDGVGRGAGELLHLAQLGDRQVEPVGALVGQHQEVALDPADLHLGEAEVAGDAVLDVDHQVALVRARGRRPRRRARSRAARARLRTRRPEDLLVGDQRQPPPRRRRSRARARRGRGGRGWPGRRARAARASGAGVDAGGLPAVLQQAAQPVGRRGRWRRRPPRSGRGCASPRAGGSAA